MQEHFEKVIGRLRTLEGLVERLQTVESLAGQVSPVKVVAVKYAEFTGTQSNSTAARANFAVTDLSITHAMAKSTNKLQFWAFFGQAASTLQRGAVGIAIADDGTLIGIGDTARNRSRVTAGGRFGQTAASSWNVTMPHIHYQYEPGDTNSHTYTLRAINLENATHTVYINRNEVDTDDGSIPRTLSAITLFELEV